MANVASAGLDASVVGSLRAALADVSGLVDRLVGQAFDMSTPCDGWTVRDVMNHLAAVTEKFSRFAAGSSGPIRQRHGDLLGTEPRRMFRSILEDAQRAWYEHPEALESVCVLPFGSFDGPTAAGMNLFDTVIHQWDIATGAGVHQQLNDDLALVALKVADLLVTDEARASGQFAVSEPPPPGASPSVRLLVVTGRLPVT